MRHAISVALLTFCTLLGFSPAGNAQTAATITKAFSPDTISGPGTSTLTFTITNPNAVTATGLAFSDAFPTGMTLVGPVTSPNCSGVTFGLSLSLVSFSTFSLAPGASCTINVPVRVSSAGAYVNTSSTVIGNGLPDGAPATAFLVASGANVAVGLAKSFNPRTIAAPGTSTLTFTIINPNTSTANSITFSDVFPAGMTVAAPNGVTTTCGPATIAATAGSGSVDATIASLAAGASCTLSVNVQVSSGGAYVNTTSTTAALNSANAALPAGAPASGVLIALGANTAPATIIKAFTPNILPGPGTSTLIFTIINPNTFTATGLAFSDAFPTGMTLVGPVTSPNCSGVLFGLSSSLVSFSKFSLGPGGSCTINVPVQVSSAGAYVNTSSTVIGNGLPDGAPATAFLVASGANVAVGLAKTFNPRTITAPGTSTLTFTIINPNTSTANSITFSDVFPAGMTVAAPNGVTTTCGPATIAATAGSGSVDATIASLAAGASCTLSVNVQVSSGGAYVNTTSTTAALNSANAALPAGAPASGVLIALGANTAPATIIKAFTPNILPGPGTSTLIFTIINPNTFTATGLAFSDAFPTGMTLVGPVTSPNCSGVLFGLSSSLVSFSKFSLGPGGSCTINVPVQVSSAGAYVNTSSTVIGNGLPDGAPATAFLVASGANVAVGLAKTFNPRTITAPGTSTLTFTIINPNTSTANSITFSDVFPAGMTVAAPNGVTTTCGPATIAATAGSGSVDATIASLAAGASCTLSVNVQVSSGGAYVNTTSTTAALNSANAALPAGAPASGVLIALGANAAPATIIKAFTPNILPGPGTSTLIFTIINPNTFTATGLAFSDAFPTGMTLVGPVTSPNCSGVLFGLSSSLVSFSKFSLGPGGSCTINVPVQVSSAGAYVNTTSTLAGNGPGGALPEGAPATAFLVASAANAQALTLAKVFNPSTIPASGTSTLAFTISNPNTFTAAAISFTDILPAGVMVAASPSPTTTCDPGTAITSLFGPTGVRVSIPSLAGGASCTVSLTVQAIAGVYNNVTSPITSLGLPTGTPASATLTVIAPPVITKSFTPTKIVPGGVSTVGFSIANPNSFVALTGVAFTDTLPLGLVVANPNGLTSTCGGTATATPGSGTISLTGSTIAASATCTVNVNVTSVVDNIYVNSVQVTSTNGGTGNTSTAKLFVATPPNLSKTFGLVSMNVGSTTSLTFALNNPNKNVTLTGLAFTDVLPTGLIVATPNGLVGACDGGTITATAGGTAITLAGAALPPGITCFFSVNVTATGTVLAQLTNTTSTVTSVEAVPGAAATASIFIGDPFQVRYSSNLSVGDSVVNITNGGASSTAAFPTQNGNICANVYTFSPDEQLVSCCTCPITPDGLVSLSARNDLISNTLTPGVPTGVVVKLLASLAPTSGACNASTVTPGNLALGMSAWGTTIHAAPVTPGTPATTFGVTETRFSQASLSAAELTRITTLCGFIQTDGSGFGICKSCRLGGLANTR